MLSWENMNKRSRKTATIVSAVVVVIIAGAVGFLLWGRMNANHDEAQNTENTAGQTTNHVIAEVGKIYKLPVGEEPTVARIQDRTKLAGQEFFVDAQNGDYLLVYSKNAKLALLYRESEGRLINVSPVNIPNLDGQPDGTGAN